MYPAREADEIGVQADQRRANPSPEYDTVNYHVMNRLRRWLCRKHKVRGQGYSRYPDRYLYQELDLYQLKRPRRSFPNATV